MAGLMAAIAIMMIFSTVAFQAWEDVLRRDNEAEMIFRAEDIVRAIQRYRQDNGGLSPERIEDLMEPGPKGNYYLRKLYNEPLSRDGKWGLLYVGPGGAMVDPNAGVDPTTGLPGLNQTGLQGGLNNSGGLHNTGGMNNPGGLQGLNNQGGLGNKGGQQGSSFSSGGLRGFGGSAFEESVAGGKLLAGLRIAGVKSLATDPAFRVYKGFTEYSQWLFSYFDLEVAQVPGQGGPGTPGGGIGGPANQGNFPNQGLNPRNQGNNPRNQGLNPRNNLQNNPRNNQGNNSGIGIQARPNNKDKR